ncbi:hypothetical protein EDC35_10625 [Thiobaca trueperi]|uniref:Uncharacterized protein n=2 Tax=Thiobaca trueperi TaxID=127458 RepID=A0A4R3MX45_9GAMM|nr:hypothetical protein EDC35_10625 [Thiobaca trueperi]
MMLLRRPKTAHVPFSPAIFYALAFVSVGAADAAPATDLVCTECVQASDLATNSVTGSKIKNGSVSAADLNAALRTQLSRLESRLAALEGGSYSKATFKGTYQCIEQSTENGGNNTPGKSFAYINHTSKVTVVKANGAGSVQFKGSATDTGRSWWVDWNKSGQFNFLGTQEDVETWKDDGTVNYSVSAQGYVKFLGDAAATSEGWISLNGDVMTIRYMEKNDDTNDYLQSLGVCVRTAR